ncbi:MAG: glycosyltransferase family 2 protein [Planctomycetota bacterium]
MNDLGTSLLGYLTPVIVDGVGGFLRLFWYFALFELPRFIALDIIVVIYRLVFYRAPTNNPLCGYSVVVPVLNEADTVEMTLRSLEAQSHKPTEIILVDDGSTDATAEICTRIAADSSRIKFFSQGERSGKSAALNRGLAHVTQDVVVFIDSDTTFDRDAMENLVRRFAEPRVVAVGGALRVRNRHQNLLTEQQAIEYGQSICLARQAKSFLEILPIISGAFGGFRTSAVRAVGGHDPGPGNDSDLTIDLRERGGRVLFAHESVCHTDVPTTLGALTKQRRRWCRNVVKNRIRKHRHTLSPFNSYFTWRNMISTLDPILYQFVFGWIWLTYVAGTIVFYPHLLLPILIGNLFLYWTCGFIQQICVILLSERPREDIGGLLFVPAFHTYRTYTRLVMLFAQLEELFTRTSKRDPFAPEKVQRAMPDW